MEHTHLRIDVGTKERLKRLAQQQGKSMSCVLRELLDLSERMELTGQLQGTPIGR